MCVWCAGVGVGGVGGHSEAIRESEPGPVHNLIGMTAIGNVSKIAVFSKIGF